MWLIIKFSVKVQANPSRTTQTLWNDILCQTTGLRTMASHDACWRVKIGRRRWLQMSAATSGVLEEQSVTNACDITNAHVYIHITGIPFFSLFSYSFTMKTKMCWLCIRRGPGAERYVSALCLLLPRGSQMFQNGSNVCIALVYVNLHASHKFLGAHTLGLVSTSEEKLLGLGGT